jgi:hypothetical protein
VAFVAKSATNSAFISREQAMSGQRSRPDRASVLDRRGGWAIGGAAALVVLGAAVLIVRAWPPLLESDVRVDVAIPGTAEQPGPECARR